VRHVTRPATGTRHPPGRAAQAMAEEDARLDGEAHTVEDGRQAEQRPIV
jgi:hypothetical protein